MSPDFIVIATLLLVLPVSLKYFLALETRTLVARARRQERQLGTLSIRLQAIDRERDVVHAALLQVRQHQQWASRRRRLIDEELQRLRASAPAAWAFETEVADSPDVQARESRPVGTQAPDAQAMGAPVPESRVAAG